MEITSDDIESVEKYVREYLSDILENALNDINETYSKVQRSWFFGAFSSKPTQFIFLPDEKEAIYSLIKYVQQKVNEMGITHYMKEDESYENNLSQSVFGLVFGTRRNIFTLFDINTQTDCTPSMLLQVQNEEQLQKTESRTHTNLMRLLATVDRNLPRKKPGYRFDEDLKMWCTYIRILGGPFLYKTVHANFVAAIPSLSAINRVAKIKSKFIFDAHLRVQELLEYLKTRKLPLAVCISEDATQIDGRIQYDSKSNQIVGFPNPINKTTGMPISDSFPATSCSMILKHFSSGRKPAKFVNVVMAQPIANYPAFCLMLYATDSKYTADEVNKRWQFIKNELAKVQIHVLTFSSDSDPRNNSAMRNRLLLGHQSKIFMNEGWFCSASNYVGFESFDFQDLYHIATKLRNWLLKTKRSPRIFLFGKYYIRISHLMFLLNHFSKDQHLLTHTILSGKDRQNYNSVLAICSKKVIALLEKNVPESQGTVVFLKMISNIIDAFSSKNISPIERIKKMWYTVFLIRIWRKFVSNTPRLTLEKNFLTQNCYACIEINAHSLILMILFLRKNNCPQYFMPFLYSSQPCEAFFGKLRSFTSMFSTKTNCSVKEILGRVDKIQLLSDITMNKNFVFPGVKSTHSFPDQQTFKLPTEDEIRSQITECKINAANDAIKFGLLNNNYTDDCFTCELPSIELKTKNVKDCAVNQQQMIQLNKVCLKNYAYKFIDKRVDENSPYVDLFPSNSLKYVVKKTSLCWLLRPDTSKLSSDRLLRVRGVQEPKGEIKQKIIKIVKKKKKKTKSRSLYIK